MCTGGNLRVGREGQGNAPGRARRPPRGTDREAAGAMRFGGAFWGAAPRAARVTIGRQLGGARPPRAD
ncbi:MAG: hypothetical protein ACK56I_26385, partial [bacterium]